MQKLSQRKYAKTIGLSHWAVGKAIRAGHIKKGFDKKTKKINVNAANNEWGNAAREKHKSKVVEVDHKETMQLSPLMAAFASYCNACDALLNTIEKEFFKLR